MRYVIRSADSGYFTGMELHETVPITAPMDIALHAGFPPIKKGEVIGFEEHYRPLFDAFKPSQACQYDTQADAQAQIQNADALHGGAAAFAGCTVVESP